MVDRNNEYYLDSSGNYSVFKNDNSQLWQVCVPENNASDFMLKNIGTGLYLSSYDLKFYRKATSQKKSQTFVGISAILMYMVMTSSQYQYFFLQ